MTDNNKPQPIPGEHWTPDELIAAYNAVQAEKRAKEQGK